MTKSTDQPLTLLQLYKNVFPLYVRYCIIVVGIILIVSFIVPASFTSTTTILPPDEKENATGLSAMLQATSLSFGALGSTNKLSLVYAEILDSRTLIEGVVDTLQLLQNSLFSGMEREDLVEYLSDRIDVESRKTGSVVVEATIRSGWLPLFTSSDDSAQVLCARVANACRTVLDRINRQRATNKARVTREYIERVLLQTKQEIDSIQSVKQRFQTEHKVLALDEQMMALVNHAVTVGTEMATAELELAIAKQDFAVTSPQVQLLEKKLAALREQYDRVQSGGLVSGDGFSIPFNQVPMLTRRFTNLVRDLKIKEQINAFLETQRMEQIIQEARDIPTVVALDVAVPPKHRSFPPRFLASILAVMVVTLVFLIGTPLRQSLLSAPQSADA